VRPEILVLDEHTAALDPKTANQILHLTDRLIREQQLTSLMVTHNMKQALQLGNRLIMMHQGEVIFEAAEEEKRRLTVEDLVERFYAVRGEDFSSDRMLLI